MKSPRHARCISVTVMRAGTSKRWRTCVEDYGEGVVTRGAPCSGQWAIAEARGRRHGRHASVVYADRCDAEPLARILRGWRFTIALRARTFTSLIGIELGLGKSLKGPSLALALAYLLGRAKTALNCISYYAPGPIALPLILLPLVVPSSPRSMQLTPLRLEAPFSWACGSSSPRARLAPSTARARAPPAQRPGWRLEFCVCDLTPCVAPDCAGAA